MKNKGGFGIGKLVFALIVVVSLIVGVVGANDAAATSNQTHNPISEAALEGNASQVGEDLTQRKSEEQKSVDDPVLQVHFLDVGQALCVLVTDTQGNELLYDAGNEGDAAFIISYLKEMDVERLEYIVNSHPHEDHIGGMDRILEKFEVDQVILSEKAYDSQAYRDVLEILDEKQIDVVYPVSGTVYALGELSIQILGPLGSEYESTNDYSVIVKVGNKRQSVLLTGDSEATAEHELVEAGVDLQADVFQVSHHGSSTSNTIQYLSKVDPQVAVISVGANNSYGHPDAIILDRLRNMGISTYETDLEGTIVMTLDGDQIFVEAKGEEVRENASSEEMQTIGSDKVISGLAAEEIDEEKDAKQLGVVITELDKRAEYVMIQNNDSEAVNLSGWRIESTDGGQEFLFPMQTILEAGGFLKITSGPISSEGDFIMAKGHVWDNENQDSARLIDSNGLEVDFFEDTNY